MLDLIIYNEESPSCLVWAKDHTRFKKGQTAGTLRKDGYWRIGKQKEYIHRLVWRLFYGEIAEGLCIDHIDGNPSNNKIGNLRLVTHKDNMRNSKKRSSNKTGVNGVALENMGGYEYYTAIWKEDGTQKAIRFSIKEFGKEMAFNKAVDVRKEAEERLGFFSERHGN